MPLTVENFCGLIIRSRLHPADAVKSFYQRWQSEVKDARNVRAFARWLVVQRHLTPYQATLLSNGYADNFFLGKYKILDRIGKGRMAGVYKAVHPSGQVVAIKVLPPSKAADSRILGRFQREAQLATQFNHVSIVRAFHYGESNGLHFLVMEHLEGITLKNYLKERGRIKPKEAARIGFLVALGLQHLFEKGVVHRDVKPSNLMLCPAPPPGEGTLRSMVKLLDVGLGRQFLKTSAADSGLTTPGLVLGTPEYLAPEQAKDSRQADARSDIYGLGCTLYHALAGRPPFEDVSPMQQILKHATQEPPTFAELRIDVPRELEAIVRGMMAKDPGKRPATPARVADSFRKFLGSEAVAAKGESALPSYLEDIQKPAKPEPAPPAPVASPFPIPETPSRASKPPPTVEKILQSKRRRRSQVDRPPAPAATLAPRNPTPSSFDLIDVELVNPAVAARAPFGLPVPRDLFMIAVGAGGVLGVVLVLWLIRYLTNV